MYQVQCTANEGAEGGHLSILFEVSYVIFRSMSCAVSCAVSYDAKLLRFYRYHCRQEQHTNTQTRPPNTCPSPTHHPSPCLPRPTALVLPCAYILDVKATMLRYYPLPRHYTALCGIFPILPVVFSHLIHIPTYRTCPHLSPPTSFLFPIIPPIHLIPIRLCFPTSHLSPTSNPLITPTCCIVLAH
jgi:hypothetical protein